MPIFVTLQISTNAEFPDHVVVLFYGNAGERPPARVKQFARQSRARQLIFKHAYRPLAEGHRNQLNRAASWLVVYAWAAARLGGTSTHRNAARFNQKGRTGVSSRRRVAHGRGQRSFSAYNK